MFAVIGSRVKKAATVSIGATALALTAAACADILSRAGSREASLSFGVASAAAGVVANEGFIVVTEGGNTIDVQSVDVVFSEMTFEGENVDSGDDDDSESDSDSEQAGNARFRSGATTVSLPLAGGVITPFTGQLPLGTYTRLEMDAEFMRIQGTYNGQPFDVTVPVGTEFELRLSPPLVVGSATDPVNVSINVDVASWFRGASGAVIDPRLLATDATLRSEFRSRVRASFRAFEDDDRDGDESDSDSDGG